MAFDINVGTRPPECKWLVSGDLEASRQSLRPTGNGLISGGKKDLGKVGQETGNAGLKRTLGVVYRCPHFPRR